MWYKIENNKWLTATTVVLPTQGDEVDYGWTWHDEPPKEFDEWKIEQDELIKKMFENG